MKIGVQNLLRGVTYGTVGGLGGFLGGLGITAIVLASGLTSVAAVPAEAILPVFATGASVLGFGAGLLEDSK